MPNTSPESITVESKVKPRSSKQKIVISSDGKLKIFLRSPAEDNKANCELRKMLSEKLRISQSSVEIIRGLKSSSKLLRLYGISVNELKSKLSA
jgi:uncharacterized protein (TIGR00251 family)